MNVRNDNAFKDQLKDEEMVKTRKSVPWTFTDDLINKGQIHRLIIDRRSVFTRGKPLPADKK